MPSSLGDVKIVSLSISTFVLNTLTLELSDYCPPYALKFSTWYLYCLNIRRETHWHEISKMDAKTFLSPHSFSLFVYILIMTLCFCATAARAKKMIALEESTFSLKTYQCSVYG